MNSIPQSLDPEIPCYKVTGDARSRGIQQGRQLRERIRDTVDFYREVLFKQSALSDDEIRANTGRITEIVRQFHPQYCVEIEAIAEAAGLPAWQLYALNARTELLNTAIPECTSILFPETRLLGQTWDWIRELEELVVLVEHQYPDGHTLLTLTEPGILAKIGMNNRGIGLCLNFLESAHQLDGVPVHVLTRAILESDSIDTAYKVITASGFGKSSHLLLADDKDNQMSMEFAGDNCAEVQMDGIYLHTNHCLAEDLLSEVLPTSRERLQQGQDWIAKMGEQTLENMKQVLTDDSMGAKSIQCRYHIDETFGELEVGTCATVMMDLPNRRFYVKKGQQPGSRFLEYRI